MVPLSAGPGGLQYQFGPGAGDMRIYGMHLENACFDDLKVLNLICSGLSL